MRLSTALFFLVSLAVITATPLPQDGVDSTTTNTLVQSSSGTSDQTAGTGPDLAVVVQYPACTAKDGSCQPTECGDAQCTKKVSKYTLMYLAGVIHGTALRAKDKLNTAKTTVGNKITSIKDAANDKATSMVNSIDDTVDDLAEVHRQIKEGLIQFGKDTEKSATDTYVKIKCQDESNRKIIAEKARKLGGKIKDGFKLVGGVLVAVGGAVSNGFWSFVDSAKQFAGEAYDAATKKLDEAADAFWAALQRSVNDAKKLATDTVAAAKAAKKAAANATGAAKTKLEAAAREAERKASLAAESLRAKLNSAADAAKKKAKEAAEAANAAKLKLEKAPANAKAALKAAYEAAVRRANEAANKAEQAIAEAANKASQTMKDIIGTSDDFNAGVDKARFKGTTTTTTTTDTAGNYQPNQQ